MSSMNRSLLPGRVRGLLSQVFDDCCLCHAPLGEAHVPAWPVQGRRPPVCPGCLSWFARTSHAGPGVEGALCLVCGSIHAPSELIDQCCRRCVGRAIPFARLVVPFRYQWPVDQLVGRLKYHEQRHLAPLFGGLLASEVMRTGAHHAARGAEPRHRAAVLLPVPLHPARRIERGFNQATDIARWCALALDLACEPNWVHRVEDTGSLAAAGRAERELAIRGAFTVDAAVCNRRVVIVDDVLTTGATTSELARECLDTGATSVELWAVARTVAREQPPIQSVGSNSSRRACSGSCGSASARDSCHTAS